PASLLARLENALPVLVGGARDLPQRQQTLHSTMAWSYQLLGAGARRLLAACSVFRGGIGLAPAETICAGLGVEVLAGLEELVDALRLAVAMFQFWRIRGHFTEGRSRLSTLLDANPGATAARVGALNGTAWLAIDQGDDEYARELLGESIQLSQELGDRLGEAMALVYFGRSLITSARPAEAGPHTCRRWRRVGWSGGWPRPGSRLARWPRRSF